MTENWKPVQRVKYFQLTEDNHSQDTKILVFVNKWIDNVPKNFIIFDTFEEDVFGYDYLQWPNSSCIDNLYRDVYELIEYLKVEIFSK